MQIIPYLFLTHFLADYPFQPGWLIKWKKKSFWGVLSHASVHLLFAALILLPFWGEFKVWLSIGIIFVTHAIIDQTKVTLEKKYPTSHHFLIYALDQITHLAIITLVCVFLMGDLVISFKGGLLEYYSTRTVIHFLLILTLVTYFYDITRWVFLNSRKPRPYKRDYRLMIRNALIVVIAFVLYWITQ